MKILNALKWLVCTKLGWLIISFLWGGTFMIISDYTDSMWPIYLAIPAALYVVGLFLVMMAYAWVINPIRDRKETKALQEKNQNK
jgi:hypothetical protein